MGRPAVTQEELDCTHGWALDVMAGASRHAREHRDDFARRFNSARSKTARADLVAERLGFCPRYFRQVLGRNRAMSRGRFLELAGKSFELGWTEVHHHPDVLDLKYRAGKGKGLQTPLSRTDRKRLKRKRAMTRVIALRVVALGEVCPAARRWRVTAQRIAAKAAGWHEHKVDSALTRLAKAIAEVSEPSGTPIALIALPGMDQDLGAVSPLTKIALKDPVEWRNMEWLLTMQPAQSSDSNGVRTNFCP